MAGRRGVSVPLVAFFVGAGLFASEVAVPARTAAAPQDNVTFHQNAMRTGWNPGETALTVASVPNLKRIWTLAAPANSIPFGKVYAQPLYVTAEPVLTGYGRPHHLGARNLVIVATSTAQLYAYDAATLGVVWHKDFTSKALSIVPQAWGDTGCQDVNPYLGIISTPVIDRALHRLYVVVATARLLQGPRLTRAPSYNLQIHAISLATGADVPGVGPTEVTGSTTSHGKNYSVSALNNFSRSALLVTNGNVYVALASHCDGSADNSVGTTHGWLLSYSTTTLQRTGNLLNATNGPPAGYFLGSPWMGGYGPAADAQGNVYFATGNGPWNGSTNFSMSVLKAPGNLDIAKTDYFTPDTYQADSGQDLDLGSGGVMLIPDQPTWKYPRLLIQGGKNSAGGSNAWKYILNRDNLGKEQANNAGALAAQNLGGPMYGGPAYFRDASQTPHVVYGGANDGVFWTTPLATYQLDPTPALSAPQVANYPNGATCLECRNPGGSQPVVSSNGTKNGTAVVWALNTPDGQAGDISLWAFDALNMGNALFTADVGPWNPATGTTYVGGAMISPLVADGRVYVPYENGVAVYGLTPIGRPAPRPAPFAALSTLLGEPNRGSVLLNAVYGTITAINGTQLTLRLRNGGSATVDAARAINSGAYSAPLFVGKQVVAQGTKRPNGRFDAARVTRVTHVDRIKAPDR